MNCRNYNCVISWSSLFAGQDMWIIVLAIIQFKLNLCTWLCLNELIDYTLMLDNLLTAGGRDTTRQGRAGQGRVFSWSWN